MQNVPRYFDMSRWFLATVIRYGKKWGTGKKWEKKWGT
jgi:hypothetical protein